MSFLPTFLAGSFALAGLALASAPLIIHLLNRRRFRVVDWAAMEFLQHAIRRNRRILHLRDLLLLILRTAVVLLFGLALAQPYFAASSSEFDGSQPLHAVLLLDNSRSMDFVSLEGTLLDRAKSKAADFIKRLPDGSVISVVPVCGSRQTLSPDPYASKQHALDALRRIECVDRSASWRDTLNAISQAGQAAPLMSKRYVWLTDQQRINFQQVNLDTTSSDPASGDQPLPDLQIVNVSDEIRANTWVAGLRVQDGVADVNTPATIVVTVRHEGPQKRDDVQVTLTVDGEVVGSSSVSLAPGGAREVVFQHTFSSHQPTPQRPATAAVQASLTPDRLPADDQRQLVVHVAASAPVVFIDQFGADAEDSLQQRFGETRSIRRLLAPGAGASEAPRQLVEVRHVTIGQVDRDLLADARLVVIAGIESPGIHTETLSQYLQQGGQVLIAAGADFSPEKWTADAWLNGAGILPIPLQPQPFGATPEESDELRPFFIDFESLQSHAYFQLSGNSAENLRDLYAEPFFFKAAKASWDDSIRQSWWKAEVDRQRERLESEQVRLTDPAEPSARAGQAADNQTWLTWAAPQTPTKLDAKQIASRAEKNALRSEPVVLASFDNGAPMLVERTVGQGRVVLFTSSLVSPWSTISKTNCFIIFDRMLRDMLRDTFPTRNFAPQQRLTVQLPGVNREVTVGLQRPNNPTSGQSGAAEIVHSGFLDDREVVFTALQSGVYHLEATVAEANENEATAETLWNVAVATQSDPRESELTEISAADALDLLPANSVRFLGANEELSMAGSQVRGQDLWWWLALAVFLLLLAEIAVLASPRFYSSSAGVQTA